MTKQEFTDLAALGGIVVLAGAIVVGAWLFIVGFVYLMRLVGAA